MIPFDNAIGVQVVRFISRRSRWLMNCFENLVLVYIDFIGVI